jgi:hypothetical protein
LWTERVSVGSRARRLRVRLISPRWPTSFCSRAQPAGETSTPYCRIQPPWGGVVEADNHVRKLRSVRLATSSSRNGRRMTNCRSRSTSIGSKARRTGRSIRHVGSTRCTNCTTPRRQPPSGIRQGTAAALTWIDYATATVRRVETRQSAFADQSSTGLSTT